MQTYTPALVLLPDGIHTRWEAEVFIMQEQSAEKKARMEQVMGFLPAGSDDLYAVEVKKGMASVVFNRDEYERMMGGGDAPQLDDEPAAEVEPAPAKMHWKTAQKLAKAAQGA